MQPMPNAPQLDTVTHRSAARRQFAPALARGVKILDVLASSAAPASLASISRCLELPRSSTLALCNTLVSAGLVVRDTAGTYRLGPHLLVFSRSYLSQTDLHLEFERQCHELDVLPEHTLVLSVLDGTDVTYIGRRRGARPVAISYFGMRLPANCTASGKALLSSLEPGELRSLYRNHAQDGLPALSPKSIVNFEALIEDLAEAAGRGYAIDDEEAAPGMICVGAPVSDTTGRAIGAVAVSMVKAALTADELVVVASELCRLTAIISIALGGRPAGRRPDSLTMRG
jgi:DNA-binding IclR family transcriptional regulator